MEKKLRDYQVDIANKAVEVLKVNKIVYIAAQVRCGKTLMALETARLFGASNVLFLTKKKAISSIIGDYNEFNYTQHFTLEAMNDESMHKLTGDYDLVVHDESHRFGSFPKPGVGAKTFKKMFANLPMIFLSGTMSPESYSQIYHQFWVSNHSPFRKYTNFYKWANDFVRIKKKYLGSHEVNDYSDADREKVMSVIKDYVLTFTQEEAGFESKIEEEILYVDMLPITYSMCNRLKKDLVLEGKEEVILADTPVKLQQKLHQMYSGTVKFESGNSMIIDSTKAKFIWSKFSGSKIGIFYKFKEELNVLKEVFKDNLTTDVEEFDNSRKCIALQIVSGREGISLRNAEYLVFYNIDFSATSYWQARDRMTTMDRKFNKVYWIFARGGLEQHIYKQVLNKKNFTLSHFKAVALK
jgi:hypothetical protein